MFVLSQIPPVDSASRSTSPRNDESSSGSNLVAGFVDGMLDNSSRKGGSSAKGERTRDVMRGIADEMRTRMKDLAQAVERVFRHASLILSGKEQNRNTNRNASIRFRFNPSRFVSYLLSNVRCGVQRHLDSHIG